MTIKIKWIIVIVKSGYKYKYNFLMFRQTFNQIPERNTISFKATNSKSIIRIEKNKLPYNFFKPLTIEVQQKSITDNGEDILSTPCFGNREEQDNKQFELTKPPQFKVKVDKDQFYSWFSKGMKPLSSRAQTLPIQMESSNQLQRNHTERKRRTQRVKSVQEEGVRSTFKITNKYQNLIGQKIQSKKSDSVYKFKLKPMVAQGIEKNFKNHFKVNNNKRGYAQTKYKQIKALNSISKNKDSTTFLPMISNG